MKSCLQRIVLLIPVAVALLCGGFAYLSYDVNNEVSAQQDKWDALDIQDYEIVISTEDGSEDTYFTRICDGDVLTSTDREYDGRGDYMDYLFDRVRSCLLCNRDYNAEYFIPQSSTGFGASDLEILDFRPERCFDEPESDE